MVHWVATRPAYQHAMATGDTEFLRLCLRTCLEVGVDPASLVHAMQNHDELTYELLHWSVGHADTLYGYRGRTITGADLGDDVRRDMCRHLTGDAAPYNLVFTTNGIACTTRTELSKVENIMAQRHIRHVPIVEDGQLKGMISSRDLMRQQLVHAHELLRRQGELLAEIERHHPGLTHIQRDTSGRVVI